MVSETTLTQVQRARIYCVKHGHAHYVHTFFGYVYCGRCGEQIGDRLGGIYSLESTLVVGHKKDCEVCQRVEESLNTMDKIILERLREHHDDHVGIDHEQVLEGVDVPI